MRGVMKRSMLIPPVGLIKRSMLILLLRSSRCYHKEHVNTTTSVRKLKLFFSERATEPCLSLSDRLDVFYMLWATERNFYGLQTRSRSLAIAWDILRRVHKKGISWNKRSIWLMITSELIGVLNGLKQKVAISPYVHIHLTIPGILITSMAWRLWADLNGSKCQKWLL